MKRVRPLPAAALVTGATSGIGEAFARALPSSTRLLLTGRDEAALGRLAADIGGDRLVETLGADLATDDGLTAVCRAAERLGIDLFICDAGQGTSMLHSRSDTPAAMSGVTAWRSVCWW
jgi:uncharacterized protein